MIIAIINHKRGIPSSGASSVRRDYVPALCTHRPSLLPIEQSGEYFGPTPARQLVRSWKVKLTLLLRGRRSRNKVSVGEPAEGSIIPNNILNLDVVWCSACVCMLDARGVWLARLRMDWSNFPDAHRFFNLIFF